MAQAQYIKHLWENEEKSLREIAEITDLNFRTVRKYAYMDDWSPEEHLRNSQAYPVLGNYIHIIDEWLENDTRQPKKQRHTAKQIHKRLVKEHMYPGS